MQKGYYTLFHSQSYVIMIGWEYDDFNYTIVSQQCHEWS
jgi:hypothetical protein